MTTVVAATTILFCEGSEDSLDAILLNRILQGKPPRAVIIPAGGKHQLRAFAQGRLAAEASLPDYLIFRDRDFDAEPPSNSVALLRLQGQSPVYLSYRTTIENYLLEPGLLDSYWQYHASNAPAWKHGASPGIEVIKKWIEESAADIANYQAVRWALAKMKPGERWPELRTTWTSGSGTLPISLSEEDCLTEAKKLIQAYIASAGVVNVEEFENAYQQYFEAFGDAFFVQQAQYLVWFQGKDIGKAMQRRRPNSISLRHFYRWAISSLDWQQHADLQQLAAIAIPA